MESDNFDSTIKIDQPESQADELAKASFETIENRYKVVQKLGSGQTSTVYLVSHLFLDKQFAIKLFKDKYWENQKRFTRAQREAVTCASIDHKNVVKVYDFGVTEDGAPYIVQEYIGGINLRNLIKQNGPLEPSRAAEVFKQIARGLNCLHENQVLHRDIKSENIVITRDSNNKEVVKLIDLGIARMEDKDGAIQSLTQSGRHIGSPYYISPELCHGSEIDNRSDIYSFGCVMYEVLSGSVPFKGESILKTLEMQLNDTPKSLLGLGVSEAVDSLVQKCLAKEKENRFSSCKEILDELDRLAPGNKVSKQANPVKSLRAHQFTIAFLICLTLILSYLLVFDHKQPGARMKTKSPGLSHRSATKLSSKQKPGQDIFTNTVRGAMLNRLTIPKKASLVFEEALNEAKEEDKSPEQKCMIAEMHCSMLNLYQNWTKIDQIALLIKKDMDTVERKAAKHKSYAQNLGSIPLLYYYISEADLEQ